MKTSSLVLSACLLFVPLNYNTKGEAVSLNKGIIIEHVTTLESAVKNDSEIQDYLKTLRFKDKKTKKTLTMLDRFPNYEVRVKVRQISGIIKVDEKHLYKMFYYESKGNPQAKNDSSNATGLIQFLPKTAESLGTTVDELRAMSTYDQLDYVLKYFQAIGKIDNSLNGVYLSVFFPAAVNKPNSYIMADTTTSRGRKILKWNKSLDLNNDSVLTKGEFIESRSKRS